MNIRDEVYLTLGIKIEESTEERLNTSIKSKNSSDDDAYGFALSSVYLDFDPSDALKHRYGQERAEDIMDGLEARIELGDELEKNMLYIACVWAAGAKKEIQHLGPKTRRQLEDLIDEIAKSSVRYWTLEPMVNQSDLTHLGIKQERASRYLATLERHKVLVKIKQGGMYGNKGQSNVYRIVGTGDFTPEQIKEAFEALNLKATTPQEQVKEFVTTSQGERSQREPSPDNPRGYTW